MQYITFSNAARVLHYLSSNSIDVFNAYSESIYSVAKSIFIALGTFYLLRNHPNVFFNAFFVGFFFDQQIGRMIENMQCLKKSYSIALTILSVGLFPLQTRMFVTFCYSAYLGSQLSQRRG